MSMPDKAIGKIPVPLVDELKKGTNYFFGIGINTYENFNKLFNARKDVEDIANVLIENYYFERKNVLLLSDQQATKENIIDELDDLGKKLKPDDRLLIYYSGHGHLEGKRGFWIPVNAIRDKVSSYISSADVRDIIQSINARHILLISDSCFSASLLVRDTTRDINATLLDWERNPSRWVFISGKGVVSDGDKGTNSPFAKGILKHLNQNDAEALNIVRLADRVTQEVGFNYEQKAEITPLFQSGHEGGQFIFFKKQTERDDWHNAVIINTEAAYSNYLEKYTGGAYVDEAYLKLNEVGDNNEWKKAAWLDSAYAYRIYLRKYPNGIHQNDAKAKIKEIENDADEAARLEKIEADKIETARIAKLKADEEAERLASIEADKIEAARIAKLKADELNARIERERLAKIEVDRIAKLKTDEAAARLEGERLVKPQPQIVYPDTSLKKNRMPIYIGGGVLVVLIFNILYLSGVGGTTSGTTVTMPTQQTDNPGQAQQNKYPAASQPVQEYKSETPATQPPKKDNDAQANVDKLARQKQKDVEASRIAKQRAQDNADEAAAAQAAESNKNQQIQADKANAKKYLKSALAYIDAGEKLYAISDLSKAYNLSNISGTTKKFIKSAIDYISANELAYAKSDVNSALDSNY